MKLEKSRPYIADFLMILTDLRVWDYPKGGMGSIGNDRGDSTRPLRGGADLLKLLSRRHRANSIIKKLRGEIGAVRPDQGLEFRVDSDLCEKSSILKGFENLPLKFITEIDQPFDPILEPNGKDKITHYFERSNLGNHQVTPDLQFCSKDVFPSPIANYRESRFMQYTPFLQHSKGALGELALHLTSLNVDRDCVLSIECMKMKRGMLPVGHTNYDPKES